MKEVAISILKERDLRVTSQRLSILSILLRDKSKAYSTLDFVKQLEYDMDRSTVYRTLDKLIHKGIITKLIESNGDEIYTLNQGKKCDLPLHPHLRCHQCGSVECLPAFPANYVSSLEKFGVKNMNIVLGGMCSKCHSSSQS